MDSTSRSPGTASDDVLASVPPHLWPGIALLASEWPSVHFTLEHGGGRFLVQWWDGPCLGDVIELFSRSFDVAEGLLSSSAPYSSPVGFDRRLTTLALCAGFVLLHDGSLSAAFTERDVELGLDVFTAGDLAEVESWCSSRALVSLSEAGLSPLQLERAEVAAALSSDAGATSRLLLEQWFAVSWEHLCALVPDRG